MTIPQVISNNFSIEVIHSSDIQDRTLLRLVSKLDDNITFSYYYSSAMTYYNYLVSKKNPKGLQEIIDDAITYVRDIKINKLIEHEES